MSLSDQQSLPVQGGSREFYELLTLLKILGPHVAPATPSNRRLSSNALQDFLDQLCWMCDYDSGGETVGSIALQATATGVTFWLATQHKAAALMELHLCAILAQVSGAHRLSARALNALEQDLTHKCIDFALKRIKFYTRLLKHFLGKCQTELNISGKQLGRDLAQIVCLADRPREICAKADLFRHSESLRLLSRRVRSCRSPSSWSMLRHYVGRLGSWHRAARTIVSYASVQPAIFTTAQVKILTLPRAIAVPQANELTNLGSVLSRVFTIEEQPELVRGIETLQRIRRLDLDSEFQRHYCDKNFKPRVHAEVWLLEHFIKNDLKFVSDEAYIACSKPSCYCCSLYFRNRPGTSIDWRSHGNVWPSWQSPLQSDSTQENLDASIRSAMISDMKEVLRCLIIDPEIARAQAPDTTTGLTLSDR